MVWSIAYGHYRNTQKTVITYYKKGEVTKAWAKVNIKTDNVTDGKCKGEATSISINTKGAKVTIAPTTGTGGPPPLTLTITNITAADLEVTDRDTECTVSEDTEKGALTIKYTQGSQDKCITIEITDISTGTKQATVPYGHIFTYKFDATPNPHLLSPFLMIVVGMGLVYAIYPGIAPGMIVPFYLVDKIETVLLVLTTFPPVIIAIVQKLDDTKGWSPKTTIRKDPPNGLGGWSKYTHPYSKKQIATKSDPVTQATLNLQELTSTHTLTLQNGDGTTVQEVKYTVNEEQKGNIDKIKGKTDPVKIKLTLNLADVTLTQGSTSNTLMATGTITTTKTVTPTGGDTVASALTEAPHNLTFTSSDSTLTQNLTASSGSVTIGPGSTHHKKLNLEAGAPGASTSKLTNLTLTLSAGTKPNASGTGTEVNEKLTLNDSDTLALTGGINGTLTYNSSNGNLTANRINSVTYDLNDFHCTYKM